MKRTSEWWAGLEEHERKELVALERNQCHRGSSWNLPAGFSECTHCSYPTSSSLCAFCRERLDEIVEKANRSLNGKEIERGA